MGSPDPIWGSGSHSSGSVRTRGGLGPNLEARTVYTGVRHHPRGSELTGDTSEYVTFSGHVVAADPPMWRGQVLLLAQSSRPRLGRVMVWSHIQLFYHATKNSRVGTASLYSSKGYPSFRVPTDTDDALRDIPRSAFERTASSIAARWFMQCMLRQNKLYRFGPLGCVILYVR